MPVYPGALKSPAYDSQPLDAGLSTLTGLELPHVSHAPLRRVLDSPHRSSDHRVGDCRGCNLESGSGALGCRHPLERMYSERDLCNIDWVWHVENMADFSCKEGMDSSRSVVHIWIPD